MVLYDVYANGDVLFSCSLTVHKEGPNTGRQFYSCSKPRGEGCSFFQWADEGSSNSRGGKYQRGTPVYMHN